MKLSKIKARIDEAGDPFGSVTIEPHKKKEGYVCKFHLNSKRFSVYYKTIEEDISIGLMDYQPTCIIDTEYFYTNWDKEGTGLFGPNKYINFYKRKETK